jgi:hypothetical protein|tara:strand:+ start:176 stop:373 length:198 start_codon:yes stop_codon:yes gene_type:complete
MKIHRSLLRDEVIDLETEMSVSELLDHIDSDNIRIAINSILEEIAIEKIIDRTQDVEEIIKRGKI